VLDDQVTGDAGTAGAHTGQGRHDDAVGELEVSEANGREQVHVGRNRVVLRTNSGTNSDASFITARALRSGMLHP
jgi:hypothetical protein